MPKQRNSRRAAVILTVLLLSQAALFYGLNRGEMGPSHRPLDQLPTQLGDWKMVQQGVMDKEILDVLRADDYVTRWYAKGPQTVASLFIAFFKSQRAGQSPHSPKNCLPGAGWIWTVSDQVPVTIPETNATIVVNRYIVQKGDQKSLSMYWYQSRDRVVASEYKAKIYVVVDALRLNRTDTAIVRVDVPITNGDNEAATQLAADFVRSFFTTLRGFLPT